VSQTFSQIYVQIVFAVEWRQCLIDGGNKEEIHKFITGIVRNDGQKLIAINSMPDHVHILVGLKPDMSLSDLVRDIKANSSRFINEKGWLRGRFRWQEGFGAFSYSHSQLDSVIRYIRNQEKRHAQQNFKDEYLEILRKFDVAFDTKHIFEFPEG
jgi:REP element-mobilizing transposase RayT